MAFLMKILLLCGLAVFCLMEVEGKKSLRERRSEEMMESSMSVEDAKEFLEESDVLTEDQKRGILDVLMAIRPQTIQVVPQPAVPGAPNQLAGLPVPNGQNPNRTMLQNLVMGSPIGNLLASGNGADGLNTAWLHQALRKCSKIDPNALTVIFPTTANGLREPKMYYFKNTTSNLLSWGQAQEWCSERGMDLVTVNDEYENRVLIEKVKQILNGAPIPTPPNPIRYWIGLNDRIFPDGFSYVGDSTGRYTDWHTGFPVATQCAHYAPLTAVDNVHMSTDLCDLTVLQRYICEVSDECTALFMSRYPTKHEHHEHNHVHLFP